MDSILGIDPGLHGGLVCVKSNGDVHFTVPMPIYTAKVGKKKQTHINLIELNDYFEGFKKRIRHCYLEKVGAMPKQNIMSMFNFGKVFGYVEALLVAYDIPYTLVTPQRWMKVMHAGLPQKMDTKDRSKIIALREYPNVELKATPKSKVPHSGIVDALLIEEYGRRQLSQIGETK